MSKVIISCTVAGSAHTPTMSDALPIPPQEIAVPPVAAAEAGAAILHLHARIPETGALTGDPDVCARFLPVIRQQTDAVINITADGSAAMTVKDWLAAATRFKPEMFSLSSSRASSPYRTLSRSPRPFVSSLRWGTSPPRPPRRAPCLASRVVTGPRFDDGAHDHRLVHLFGNDVMCDPKVFRPEIDYIDHKMSVPDLASISPPPRKAAQSRDVSTDGVHRCLLSDENSRRIRLMDSRRRHHGPIAGCHAEHLAPAQLG